MWIYFPGDKNEKKILIEFRDSARKWLKKSIEAIDILRPCGDCYVNAYKCDVTLVCSKPHLIIWAQCEEYPYWPAKIKKVGEGLLPISVDFFGDATTASLAYSKCYLYSKEDPNDYLTGQYRENIRIAMKVSFT